MRRCPAQCRTSRLACARCRSWRSSVAPPAANRSARRTMRSSGGGRRLGAPHVCSLDSHVVCLPLCFVSRPKEILLPYVLDPRHAPDTLFFVAECDFRFYRQDCHQDEAAFGDDLAVHMFDVVQAAIDRGLEAATGRAESLRGAEAQGASASSGARGSADRAPPASVGGAASAAARGRPPRGPSPSPAPGREVSPHGIHRGLVDVLLPRAPDPPAGATETTGASVPSPSPAGAGGGTREPSPSPAVQEEVRRAFLEGLTAREPDMTFFGWERSPPSCEPSQELKDLVRVCTAAQRRGRGNFVWLAWEANNERRTMPSHGLTLAAVTPTFARSFLQHLEEVEPDHLDLVLLRWLRAGGAWVRERACFLYPSCGSYLAHISGCESSLGVRESSWDKSWIGEACRCRRRGARYVASWVEQKGPAEWLCRLDLDDDSLVWRTERPPTSWQDPRWGWRLWSRGWVDENWEWVGPAPPGAPDRRRAARGRGRGAVPSPSPAAAPSPSPAAQPWQAGPGAWQRTLEQLREDPDGCRQLRGRWFSPITRLAEELVTDPHWLDQMAWGGANSRVGRHRRQNIGAYLRRQFVETAQVPAPFFFALSPSPAFFLPVG